MRKAQGRKVLVFFSEVSQIADDIDELAADQHETFLHYDKICVVAYVAGCCPQMYDAFGFRTLQSVSVYMRHHIVTNDLFSFLRLSVVDVIHVGFQFFDLFICNVESQFLFGFSQGDPEPAPCSEFLFG